MLSPETGSSSCLKQTLGAPDATESYALSLGCQAPHRDPGLPHSLSAAALPLGEGGGVSAARAGAVVAKVLCVPAVAPLQESRWVSDGLCPASLKGRDSSNKAGIRDVSVCGAHATPRRVETRAVAGK